EEKAKEHGVPVVYVNPRNTSRLCPTHGALIKYSSSRVGVCSTGGEKWHRDAAACLNLLLKALGSDEGNALSRPRLELDGSHVPLGLTATHEPTQISKSAWTRWKSLDMKEHEQTRMNIQGQTA
ncbi:transposase, partial [Candidatus Bathyarchaeota archaeon]|nr:transposase [Candidatus Bathyarchaeota archaeon]